MENKMKIEIWSDVMCPFCYIGKRNLETALEQFEHKNNIEIIWKSFQLDPTIPDDVNESHQEYLEKRKGLSAAQVKSMLDNVTQTAKNVGLDYDLDKSVVANSFNAHKLIQFAKTKNLGDEAEEQLFKAFFTEAKNINNLDTLLDLGEKIGLDVNELKTALNDEKYANLVNQDIQEGQQIGVQGVPFFVLNRKYAVSGAQPSQLFLESLEKSFDDWQTRNSITKLDITEGQSCTTDGICD